jgi:hypothetical protein
MGFGETGHASVGWIALAQDRDELRAVVNAVMNTCSIKSGEFD